MKWQDLPEDLREWVLFTLKLVAAILLFVIVGVWTGAIKGGKILMSNDPGIFAPHV